MPPTLAIKTLLNQYRIEEPIALTPFGDLYRATDERSGKPIALTILSKSVSENPETLKEFEANFIRLQNISRPNLNTYLGLQKTPDHTFLLEEWVDGPSLKNIHERGRLSAGETLFITKSICGGLEPLHKQNLLHLHLAPELIRINKRGEVILCGLAGVRAVNSKSETKFSKYQPLYTSPEGLRDETLTTAADIYSLAVMLYELTTGSWINGKSAPKTSEAIRKTHLDATPPAPASLNRDLPDNFSRMILWALRKNPDDRLKTTTELLSSLALAAQIPLDKVPPRATPEIAPVISAALNAWTFLPPPKATSVSADAIPLEERLAAISGPKKKATRRIGLVPILLFIIVAGFLSLFLFIRPAAEPTLPTPLVFTSIIVNYTPPPTASHTPRPTLTNGGRIVFTCTRGDYNQLCMINRDGTDLVQLTDMAASNYYPVFTPDGSSVLFASNRAGPAFDFFILNFSEREVFQVTNNVGNVISPDYSADGRFIIFANRVGDGPTAVWMVNADGLNPHLIYTGSGDIVSVSWSPDGEKIAYAMNTGTPQEYEIFTMDKSGRNHIKISQGLQGIGGSVDWSPDGTSLLVYAGPFGDKDIFKIDVATGDFVQLTDGGNNAGASYSPNGQFIVFNSLRNDDQADLYIMESDGSGMRQITNDPEPDWGANWIE
ncbi:MAG: serine/threonine-protein kinase [Chloroflexi bacterium]|nr:serine/threonine-protein kinase [Chloroflexota bacterium]MBI3167952.1 serine/threonine-protein kinase [Chloroflexota bacterium]